MGFRSKIKKTYRKVYGHKSPYRRTYGSRSAGQAIGVTYRQGMGVAKDVANLIKTVKEMKKKQNVEKNYIDKDVFTGALGQVSVNIDGIQVNDVTPSIPQGDGQGNRHGNSLKLTGMSFPMSFIGQINCHSARKIVVSLVRVRDNNNNTSQTNVVETLWDTNPLNGLRDTGAPRNYRNAKHDGVSIIRQKTYMLKATQQNLSGNIEQSHFSAKFNVSLQDILRYETNADNFPDGTRYWLIIQTDAGNRSGTTSTLDVPVTTGDSGIVYRISQRAWYVDN